MTDDNVTFIHIKCNNIYVVCTTSGKCQIMTSWLVIFKEIQMSCVSFPSCTNCVKFLPNISKRLRRSLSVTISSLFMNLWTKSWIMDHRSLPIQRFFFLTNLNVNPLSSDSPGVYYTRESQTRSDWGPTTKHGNKRSIMAIWRGQIPKEWSFSRCCRISRLTRLSNWQCPQIGNCRRRKNASLSIRHARAATRYVIKDFSCLWRHHGSYM